MVKGGEKRCICHICTCGRHKCPHHPVTSGPNGPCSISEYSREFVPRDAPRVQAIKPAANRGDPGSFDSITNYKTDYVPHPLDRVKAIRQDAYTKPEGEFANDTNYKVEFTPKPYAKQGMIKKEFAKRNPGPFEGEPTYKVDYQKWDMEPHKKAGPDFHYVPPTEKFGGQSSMKTDFIPYNERPPAPCKPTAGAFHSEAPFAGNTDYKDSYIKHPLEARFQKEKAVYQPTGVPLDSLTTFKRDFTPKEGGKMDSCKPTNTGFASNAPFVDDTTNKNDFRQWPLDKPQAHHAADYVKPDGSMDGTTTYATDFVNQPYAKQDMMKPTAKLAKQAPFEGVSHYRESFHPHGYARVQPINKQGEYQPNPVKFEGQSTFTSDFISHPIDRVHMLKPTNEVHKSSGPLDDSTTYKDDYIKRQLEPCPAAMLSSPRTGHAFSHQDATGHKFYQPLDAAVEAVQG